MNEADVSLKSVVVDSNEEQATINAAYTQTADQLMLPDLDIKDVILIKEDPSDLWNTKESINFGDGQFFGLTATKTDAVEVSTSDGISKFTQLGCRDPLHLNDDDECKLVSGASQNVSFDVIDVKPELVEYVIESSSTEDELIDLSDDSSNSVSACDSFNGVKQNNSKHGYNTRATNNINLWTRLKNRNILKSVEKESNTENSLKSIQNKLVTTRKSNLKRSYSADVNARTNSKTNGTFTSSRKNLRASTSRTEYDEDALENCINTSQTSKSDQHTFNKNQIIDDDTSENSRSISTTSKNTSPVDFTSFQNKNVSSDLKSTQTPPNKKQPKTKQTEKNSKRNITDLSQLLSESLDTEHEMKCKLCNEILRNTIDLLVHFPQRHMMYISCQLCDATVTKTSQYLCHLTVNHRLRTVNKITFVEQTLNYFKSYLVRCDPQQDQNDLKRTLTDDENVIKVSSSKVRRSEDTPRLIQFLNKDRLNVLCVKRKKKYTRNISTTGTNLKGSKSSTDSPTAESSLLKTSSSNVNSEPSKSNTDSPTSVIPSATESGSIKTYQCTKAQLEFREKNKLLFDLITRTPNPYETKSSKNAKNVEINPYKNNIEVSQSVTQKKEETDEINTILPVFSQSVTQKKEETDEINTILPVLSVQQQIERFLKKSKPKSRPKEQINNEKGAENVSQIVTTVPPESNDIQYLGTVQSVNTEKIDVEITNNLVELSPAISQQIQVFSEAIECDTQELVNSELNEKSTGHEMCEKINQIYVNENSVTLGDIVHDNSSYLPQVDTSGVNVEICNAQLQINLNTEDNGEIIILDSPQNIMDASNCKTLDTCNTQEQMNLKNRYSDEVIILDSSNINMHQKTSQVDNLNFVDNENNAFDKVSNTESKLVKIKTEISPFLLVPSQRMIEFSDSVLVEESSIKEETNLNSKSGATNIEHNNYTTTSEVPEEINQTKHLHSDNEDESMELHILEVKSETNPFLLPLQQCVGNFDGVIVADDDEQSKLKPNYFDEHNYVSQTEKSQLENRSQEFLSIDSSFVQDMTDQTNQPFLDVQRPQVQALVSDLNISKKRNKTSPNFEIVIVTFDESQMGRLIERPSDVDLLQIKGVITDIPCLFCDDYRGDALSLSEHCDLVHYICRICVIPFSTRFESVEHKRIHEQRLIERYECFYCLQLFDCIGKINGHFVERHSRQSCLKFNTKSVLDDSEKIPPLIIAKLKSNKQCPYCYLHLHANTFMKHLSLVHKTYVCQTCKRKFCNKDRGETITHCLQCL